MSGHASGERTGVDPADRALTVGPRVLSHVLDAEDPDWDDDLIAARWATYLAAAERHEMLGV